MKYRRLGVSFGVLLLFSIAVCGEQEGNYLIKKCESIMYSDFITSIEVSDVEGKGTLNILAGTSYNGVLYNFVYDRSTNCLDDWTAKSQFNTKGDIEEIVVKDADNDGRREIILNGAKSEKQYTPEQYLFVLSMKSDSLLQRWGYSKGDSGCQFSNSVDAADLKNLGEESLIMGTESKKVCAFVNWSKNQRNILWASQALDNPVEYVQASDFNKDGKQEIVALTTNRRNLASVYLLDNGGRVLWQHEVAGGVRTKESKNIWVDDLDGDGKLETIIGTQDHGVDVLDSGGNLVWNFKTASGSKPDIVSKLRTYKYFTGDTTPKVVVAAKPYIYLLDDSGNIIWKSLVNTTVFDFDYGDIDGDGKNELVAGATSYIYVYGDNGQIEGVWSYVAEIQGMTGVYKKRDMDTVKVGVYDFDKDGKYEILAAFKWFDDQLDLNIPQGSIRIFEVNPDYNPGAATEASNTAGTTKPAEATQATVQKTTVTTPQTTRPGGTTATTTPKTDGKKGICPCIPLLPAALALAAALALGLPLALCKK